MEAIISFCIQVYSNRELEDQLTKIREVLSDEKHDWEHRVVAVRPRNQKFSQRVEAHESSDEILIHVSSSLLPSS